jgi:hypothetical protein
MKIRIEDGLPLVSVTISYKGRQITLQDILFDTGCANTIFDTDLLEEVGIELDLINGTARRMYGVGGVGELCYEQHVENLQIDSCVLENFRLQLGMTREAYGFDGILGIDFMRAVGLRIDFDSLEVLYRSDKS